MTAFDRLIGHEAAVERFRRLLERGTVPHAVLLQGPRHLGKRTFAYALASALLGVDPPSPGGFGEASPVRHPDFVLVERERDAKTGKLKKNIPVEAVRALRERLRMSAFLGGAKVAVLDEAEALSDEAANALLKTLEEPAPRTHLLLVAHEAAAVPRTVASRCAIVPFRRIPERALMEGLAARGAAADEAARAASRADGRPGLAVALCEDSGMVDWFMKEERRWAALGAAPLHRRFSLLGELAPPRADREEAAARVREAVAVWETALRRDLKSGSASAARALRGLMALRDGLDTNVSPRLLLERFALELEP